jgi:hypothetical protein
MNLIDICLLFAIDNVDLETLNSILKRELSSNAKLNVLLQLDPEHKKHILINLGFNIEFIKTL